jgi:hypothetical protein
VVCAAATSYNALQKKKHQVTVPVSIIPNVLGIEFHQPKPYQPKKTKCDHDDEQQVELALVLLNSFQRP